MLEPEDYKGVAGVCWAETMKSMEASITDAFIASKILSEGLLSAAFDFMARRGYRLNLITGTFHLDNPIANPHKTSIGNLADTGAHAN